MLTLLALVQALKSRIVLYVLPVQRQLRDVAIPTLKKHLESFNIDESDYHLITSPTEISFPNGGKIVFRSAEQLDNLRGLNVHDLCIDEAGYVDNYVFKVLIGRVRNSDDGQIRLVGTPSGDDHWFSTIEADTYIQTTLANPFIPDAYKIDLIKAYGGLSNPWARQELLGEVIGNLKPDALIDMIKFVDTLTRPWIKNGKLVCSLDPSRFGDDKSAITIRDGNGFIYAETRERTSGTDLQEWLKELYTRYGFKHLVVDTAGVGGLWFDTITSLFPRVDCHDFNGAKTKGIDKRVKNLRAHSWLQVKKFIEEYGYLGNHEVKHLYDNIKQQCSEQSKFYNEGKLQLLSKEEMRRKGINSPDIGDSIAMSLCIDESTTSADVMESLYSFDNIDY